MWDCTWTIPTRSDHQFGKWTTLLLILTHLPLHVDYFSNFCACIQWPLVGHPSVGQIILLSNCQALSSVSVVQFASPNLSAKLCSKLGLGPTCDYYYEMCKYIPKWLASNRRVLVYHRQVMSHERIRGILCCEGWLVVADQQEVI